MTYPQALVVGWSIYWREAMWALALTVPLVLLGMVSPKVAAVLAIPGILFLHLAAFPRVISSLPEIRYSGFNLGSYAGRNSMTSRSAGARPSFCQCA